MKFEWQQVRAVTLLSGKKRGRMKVARNEENCKLECLSLVE